jgi:hypothetical protein
MQTTWRALWRREQLIILRESRDSVPLMQDGAVCKQPGEPCGGENS